MRIRQIVSAVILAVVASCLTVPTALADTPAQRFIVKTTTAATGTSTANEVSAAGAVIEDRYTAVMSGFAASLTSAQVTKLKADSRVVSVTPDQPTKVGTRHPGGYYGEFTSMGTRSLVDSWGLGRMGQRGPVGPNDGPSYYYDSDGEGTTIYVVDSGIRLTHREFLKPSTTGYDFVDNDNDASDCNGHGTHVAGIAAGVDHGVAELATLVSLRVFDCGASGWMSTMIAALDWVVAHKSGPAVVNISGGGSAYPLLDEAVARTVAAGVPVVVAAMNNNADACNYSPARAPSAITVGASSREDQRASFSNYGACVDIWAPGVDIPSTWNTSDTAEQTLSGTSMATPFVTGSVARYLEYHRADTAAQALAYLSGQATVGYLTGLNGSVDRLLYLPRPVPSQPPRNATYTYNAATRKVSATWDAPTSTGSVPVVYYSLCAVYTVDGPSSLPRFNCSPTSPAGRSATIPDPIEYGSHGSAFVLVYTKAGTVTATTSIPVSTPAAPAEGLAVTRSDANATATLTWQPPSDDIFTFVTGYKVSRDGTDNRGNGAWSTTLPANARSQTFSWLNGATTYTLTVQAIREGNVLSAPATIKVTMGTTIPAVATAVSAAKSDAAATATLTWAPPASNGGSAITGYKVSRDGIDNRGNGAWSATVPASARSQVFSWLNGATSYNLSVQAITAAGASPVVTKQITMGTTIPAVPTAVTTTRSDSASTATLSWAPPAKTGGSAITGYKVSRDGTDNRGNGAWSITVPASARSQVFSWLNGATSYTLSVQAITAAGTGPAASAKITMGTTPSSIPLTVTASKNDTTKQATITWTAPASSGGSAITGYVVTRDGTDSAGNGPRTVTVSASTRNTVFTALKPRTTYTFTVKAINAAGGSPTATVRITMA